MPKWAFLFLFLFLFLCYNCFVMKLKKSLFFTLVMLCVAPAFAGWQYDGYYIDDGFQDNDRTRFVIGARGGLSWGNAKIENNIGSLYGYYYVNEDNGDVISALAWQAAGEPSNYLDVGYGDLSTLPAKEKYSKTAFAAGASIGFTVPYHPNWRLEAGYDHISETDYNQTPLFEGDLYVTGGADISEAIVHVASGGAMATVSTDIISAMAYYDFFDEEVKPVNTVVPYIGFGLGYASSRTTLKLSDIYGDLSTDSDLQNYGTATDGVIQFTPPSDKSKYPTSTNVAAIGALGASYGINNYTYLDFSARVMYIPKITWNLVNSDASQHREWFSAKNMIYTNLMIGIRFEF